MPVSETCLSVLQLSAIKGLGLKTFHHLYKELASVAGILSADFQMLKDLGIKAPIARSICQLQDVQASMISGSDMTRLLSWSEGDDQFVLCLEDGFYPAHLKEIYCPPPLIYVKGCLSAFNMSSIALVGSRKPSIGGEQHAFSFAKELSLAGLCINSGLAIGVDSAAHRGALDAGGVTCAVLGTGLDVIYPKKNIGLAGEVCQRGVLISEMSLGALPVPANFPRRNRIISGLSQGVLVVEASLKSGSLITANYAIEQNRDVYAIPGSIDSPVSSGCHALIKQGAQLVESVEDILQDGLVQRVVAGKDQDSPAALRSNQLAFEHLGDDERTVMNYVDYQCVSFDLLMHFTGLDINQLTHLLIGLELKGELSSVPGGYQRVKTVNSPA